jgi:hypothetical protein
MRHELDTLDAILFERLKFVLLTSAVQNAASTLRIADHASMQCGCTDGRVAPVETTVATVLAESGWLATDDEWSIIVLISTNVIRLQKYGGSTA